MRFIGAIADKQQVERFVAYLITQNISVQVEQDAEKFQVWARDEDQVAAATQLLNEFVAAPENPKYSGAIAAAHEILHERTRQRREARKRVRTSTDLQATPRYRAPLTLFLFGMMVVIWLVTGLGHPPFNDAMHRMLFTSVDLNQQMRSSAEIEDGVGMKLYNVRRGEVWRLITPAFIHFGATHMIFNLLAWLMLGRPIEHRYGTWFFALLVLGIALVSNVLQAMISPELGGTALVREFAGGSEGMVQRLILPFGGLSGVVYGLIGFAWIKSEFDPSFGYRVPLSLVIWAVAWFYLGVSSLDEQWLNINMANWAHGSGFVLGILMGLGSNFLRSGKTRSASRTASKPNSA